MLLHNNQMLIYFRDYDAAKRFDYDQAESFPAQLVEQQGLDDEESGT